MSKLKTTLKDPDIDYRLLDERGPTPERLQRNRTPPIELAHSKGQIDRAQYGAALRLWGHWIKSGIAGQLPTCNLEWVPAGGDRIPITEIQEGNRGQYRRAIAAISNERARSVVIQVVCGEVTPIEVGHALGYKHRDWARAHALALLTDGLDVLCRMWNITST